MIQSGLARTEARGVHCIVAIGHYTFGEVYVRMALHEGKASWAEISRNLAFTFTVLPRAAALARRRYSL